ncbi:MAG: hypothetical protein WCJ30_00095 [Deltaproteobacteria bacterium]
MSVIPRRRPRPAPESRALPRADRLAAALALGLVLPGCCRLPFDPARVREGDAPWWVRLAQRFHCDLSGDEPPAGTTSGGAVPVAVPTAPDPNGVSPPGQMALVRPDPPPVQGGARSVSPAGDPGAPCAPNRRSPHGARHGR